jgi:hypothetical protein
MATIHVTMSSQLAPQVVLAASHDFSAQRADVFPAVSTDHLEVHDLNLESADVTEGTPAGIGLNWERCHYDWMTPGVVTASVIDSNVYEPSSSRWVLRAAPDAGGSRIEMIWVREFRSGPRGRIFGMLFRLFGKRIFTRYARQVVRNIESLAVAGR